MTTKNRIYMDEKQFIFRIKSDVNQKYEKYTSDDKISEFYIFVVWYITDKL